MNIVKVLPKPRASGPLFLPPTVLMIPRIALAELYFGVIEP